MITWVGLQSYGLSLSWSEYLHMPAFERQVMIAEVARRLDREKS